MKESINFVQEFTAIKGHKLRFIVSSAEATGKEGGGGGGSCMSKLVKTCSNQRISVPTAEQLRYYIQSAYYYIQSELTV